MCPRGPSCAPVMDFRRPDQATAVALDASWVQLDRTEVIRWAEGAISAVSRATLIFLLIILQIFIVGHKVCCIIKPMDPNDNR
eukprot:COSAG01_NODE_3531_length_5963_cov_101.190655_6_plen_83_part_00